jgi:hypothetical protein
MAFAFMPPHPRSSASAPSRFAPMPWWPMGRSATGADVLHVLAVLPLLLWECRFVCLSGAARILPQVGEPHAPAALPTAILERSGSSLSARQSVPSIQPRRPERSPPVVPLANSVSGGATATRSDGPRWPPCSRSTSSPRRCASTACG